MNVLIGEEDELGSFIFRTTGHNSIRTLAARLRYFHAISGGKLATLPMELKLRGKSTAQSHRAPIYYVDLTNRAGSTLDQTIAQAKELHEARLVAGMDQAALDEAASLLAAAKFPVILAGGGVILSAGTMGSPKVLMLSGIGPADELARHGIRAIPVQTRLPELTISAITRKGALPTPAAGKFLAAVRLAARSLQH